ncbi:MAG: DinB family protein [Nocardioides sp.]
MSIEPDTKDWTWVLERPCEECGFDAAALDRATLPDRVRTNAAAWQEVLLGDDAAVRPAPHIWSPLEYACHVRDVHTLFGERVALMLAEDDPVFANWDQDATAVEDRYDEQQPAVVAAELLQAAARVADLYEAVEDGQWERPGRRSNGSAFTVDSLGRYHLHDVEHHLGDVRS